jgi:hypothetical protein
MPHYITCFLAIPVYPLIRRLRVAILMSLYITCFLATPVSLLIGRLECEKASCGSPEQT